MDDWFARSPYHLNRASRLPHPFNALALCKCHSDLTLYDIERPEWTPCHDPVRNLVYCADGRSVSTVLVEGQVVYSSGRALGIDAERLLAAAKAAADAIARRLRLDPRPRWLRIGAQAVQR